MKCLAATGALAALVGCQTADFAHKNDGRSTNQAVNDDRITSMVKTELGNEPVYKFNDIGVKTFAGIVQLSGFVDSDQQKSRAAEIVQHVPGVNRVENGLTVKPNPTGRANNMRINNGLNAASNPTIVNGQGLNNNDLNNSTNSNYQTTSTNNVPR